VQSFLSEAAALERQAAVARRRAPAQLAGRLTERLLEPQQARWEQEPEAAYNGTLPSQDRPSHLRLEPMAAGHDWRSA